MKLGIVLTESNKKIEARVNAALKKETDKIMRQAANRMIVPIRSRVRAALLGQPEVASLDSGKLKDQFGIPDGLKRVTSIIDYWVNNITVKHKGVSLSKGNLSASFELQMIQSDFQDVIHKEAAIIQTNKGQPLPWLEWLLRFGDKAIIIGYDVSLANNNRSRTGNAIMVKTERKNWRVPPEFAGTPTNNFVTRAIDSIESDIQRIIEKTLRSLI